MKTYDFEGHAPSFLPDGADASLVWHDEFDGTELDASKWDYRLSMMGKRHPAWTDRAVRLDGKGNAVFEVVLENGKPVSSQLQTGHNFMDEPVPGDPLAGSNLHWRIGKLFPDKFTHRYGYYECRCRLQQRPGWWSAFWMQSPIIGATLDTATSGVEIDIMESFKPGIVDRHAFHAYGYGPDRKSLACGAPRTLDKTLFHTFGLLWTPEGYTVYIDGEEDSRMADNVSHYPEFILVSTEVDGYRCGDGTPTQEAFDAVGDTFLVDHIRVFDLR